MQVNGIKNNYIGHGVAFGRKPKPHEEKFIQEAMNNSYDFIGAKERVAITHGSCFPAFDRNTHIGSPVGTGARKWIEFLALYGFNGVQLGPCGELKKGENSPYSSSAFAKNRMFIDLKDLTQDKWGRILSTKTYNDVTSPFEKTDKNYEWTDFDDASITYDKALKESYQNYKTNLSKGQPEAMRISKEFDKFLAKHDERLIEEGVFKVLSNEYGTDEFTEWSSQRDISLISNINKGDFESIERFDKLYKDNKNSIEQYKFEQFIITKQLKENKAWRDKIGFKYINDLLVGCSKMDAWRHEDAFLKDWSMGARENYSVSQRWNVNVLDPKKIFIFKDGKYELNTGGEFLNEKIEFALEFCENIRVDHVMGLIEPYILRTDVPMSDFISNPPSNKNKNIEKYISELKDPNNSSIEYDEFWDYPKLLEHLVLPAFKKHDIDKNLPVWEDICTYPDRFKMIYSKLKLPGITNIDWNRSEDTLKNGKIDDWYIISSHDNGPTMNYLKRIGNMKDGSKGEYTRESDTWAPVYLAGYMNMDDTRPGINKLRKDLEKLYWENDVARTNAKFSELMTTPKFQISFHDILGITEEGVVYNIPGSNNETHPQNWKERITPDFEEKYYENLSSDNPTAINFPERVKDALQAKMDMIIKASGYNSETREEVYAHCKPIMEDLDRAIEILKEKENAV